MEGWREFYVVSGGAAAALVGLMFVVVSVGQIGARSRADALVAVGMRNAWALVISLQRAEPAAEH